MKEPLYKGVGCNMALVFCGMLNIFEGDTQLQF